MEYARYAEERGFEAVWQAESRLVREADRPDGRLRRRNQPHQDRFWRDPASGPATSGCSPRTFATLDELAPGRMILGLGAWWEPLATKVGIDRRRPLRAMREVVESTRRLLAMERVTYHGDFVNLDDVEIDIVHGDRAPKHVPIYVGATGMQMMELAAEIERRRGTQLHGRPRLHQACDARRSPPGLQRSGRSVDDIDRPQLVVCSLDEDREPGAGPLTRTSHPVPGPAASHHEGQRRRPGAGRSHRAKS